MEQRPVVMSKSLMISATERAQRRIKEWEEFSTAVLTDGRKEERLTRLECKACFYPGRVGGAAMTYRPCMSCGSRELYGSTNTDVLCAPCATAVTLPTKRTGADSRWLSA